MDEREFLQQVFLGKTPSIDEFVDVLGDRLPLLRDYKSTPQDREWHAEGRECQLRRGQAHVACNYTKK